MAQTHSISVISGRVAGPILAAGIYFLPPELWLPDAWAAQLSPAAQATAAVACWMAAWWISEAVPLPVTSLLPLVLFPLTGVLNSQQAAEPYANKFVFLFLGGFMIAQAVERWNLHRRIALFTVLTAGTRPPRLVAGFMGATAFLSMWISNTASTVMMLPIAMSLISLLDAQVAEASSDKNSSRNFATGLMLGVAYAASIGGLATLVGTPTNALLAGFAADRGIAVGFGRWFLFAAPLSAILLVLAWLMLTRWTFPVAVKELPGGRQVIRDELHKLGPVSRAEWTVGLVFAGTAIAWVLREPLTGLLQGPLPVLARVDDTLIALLGAISLFLIPVGESQSPENGEDETDSRRVYALDWETAVRIPWGVLLLFGGGFSLAAAIESSGLAVWIGERVQTLDAVPVWILVLAVVALIVFLTELTSNTPTAAAFLPILATVAIGLDVPPLLLLIPTTLAATCAFMLPVATPPNAIVFGSGRVSAASMVRAGWRLNLLSILLIPAWMYLFGQLVFGI